MTPSTILLTICTSVFFALSGTFVYYFIRKSFQKKAFAAMRVSKRAKRKKPGISLHPVASLSESQTTYPLAKVK